MRRLNLKTTGLILAITGAGFVVSGCSFMQKTFGSNKSAPDEFEVVGQAPLVMPPDFNLHPPKPGEPRPQELDSTSVAINALFPTRTALPQPGSKGEQALLKAVDPDGTVTPNARSNVGDKTAIIEKGVLLKDVVGSADRFNEKEGNKIEHVSSTPVSPN